MRAAGKYKGWANLPDVRRIDVRQEIANTAAVGARNVSNVKTIIEIAHPRLIEALQCGTLTMFWQLTTAIVRLAKPLQTRINKALGQR